MVEAVLPLSASFHDCLIHLNEMLQPEFHGSFRLDRYSVFMTAKDNIPLSSSVTLSRLNLYDGIRIVVY